MPASLGEQASEGHRMFERIHGGYMDLKGRWCPFSEGAVILEPRAGASLTRKPYLYNLLLTSASAAMVLTHVAYEPV